MSGQSVSARAVGVAGVFAPGHLGELTQIVPGEMVDAVLAETGRTQRRVRLLPSRVVVYFVLAAALFTGVGYRLVWAKLTAGLDGQVQPGPSASALRQARRRVGAHPLRALFELLAGPLAWRTTPGAWWRGLRVVAVDGTTMAVPDSNANRAWAGKHRSANQGGTALAGYPLVRLVTLVECGTRAVLAAVFGPPASGELDYTMRLVSRLRAGMVLLADRNFDAGDFLAAVSATGAELLVRLKANRRPALIGRYRDGSIGSIIAGVPVRIIEATITVTGADGTRRAEHYRLVTTLLDTEGYPAEQLIRLYHDRWEIESAYLALKHTILDGHILRSGEPAGLSQELWALLTVYQILRIAMVNATDSRPGTDPDRAAFTVALHTARDQLINARNVIAATVIDLIGTIGRHILDNLLPTRQPRTSPRTVKRPLSAYAYHKPTTPTSKITIHITITDAATSPLTRHNPP